MSSPEDPVSGVLIAGSYEQMRPLGQAAGINLVRGSATQQPDDSWTVVAYATQSAIAGLQDSGVEVTVLADPATIQARWDAVQNQDEH